MRRGSGASPIRRDHANIGAYYEATRLALQPLYAFVEDVLCSLELLATDKLIAVIESVDAEVVRILTTLAPTATFPRLGVNFVSFGGTRI
jgi:hypothetical protein